MPPRRKRRSQHYGGGRRKKENQGVMQRSPSSSSSDHVYLISPPPPPPNEDGNAHTAMESTGKRRGRKAKELPSRKAKAIQETLDSLKETMQPIPPSPNEMDLSEFEEIFQKLGLWEFAHLEMEQEMRLDELTQLVATYDPAARCSTVKGLRIKVSRADLARALRIPHRKDKNSVEILDSKASAVRPIDNCGDELIRNLLYFISTRVCPSDDPCLTTEEMVDLATSAVKSDQPVDWASLIWSKAEKELLQGRMLEKFYYASHFQQLIKFQKPQLLNQDLLQIALEEGECLMKTRAVEDLQDINLDREVAIQDGAVTIEHNETEGSQQKLDPPENADELACDAVAVDPSGLRENEKNETLGDEIEKGAEENMPENTLRPCSLQHTETKISEEGSKDSRKSNTDSENKAGPVEVSSRVIPVIEPTTAEQRPSEQEKSLMLNADTHLEKSTSAEHLLSEIEKAMMLNPSTHHEKSTSAEHLISEMEKGMMLNPVAHFEKPTSAEHLLGGIEKTMLLNGGPSHSGNTRKRETEEGDVLHNEREKKLRPEMAWDAGNFEMCMEHVYEWGRRAEQMHIAEKESVISRANIEIHQLSEQLQQRDYLIRTLQIGKQEQHQRELEFSKLSNEFVVTNEALRSYIKAFDEAKHTMVALQGSIADAHNTIEILKGQLQHEQDALVEFHSLKRHINDFSQHMETTYDKLTRDVEMGMQRQGRLEQQLSVLKAEFEKRKSIPSAPQ